MQVAKNVSTTLFKKRFRPLFEYGVEPISENNY